MTIKRVTPTNPVVKAMIQNPNRSLKKHKSSRWKLFEEILEREIRKTRQIDTVTSEEGVP